jgi:hypothetical protein
MKSKILVSLLSLALSGVGWQGALAQEPDEGFIEGDTFGDEGQDYFVVEGDESVPEEYPADIQEEVDVAYFYDKLSPYGEWIWTPEYGWVWHPLDVWEDWRPYTYGQWVYTQYGWTWSSHFDWGWAPFHYGTWALLDYIGWVWVPGRVWAPAWVMWRYSDAYVGWAPILAGYSYWYGWAYYPVYYSHWTFINWNHFCDSHPHHHYLPRKGVRDAFQHSYFPRRCREKGGISCHRGLSRTLVSKQTKVQIKARVVDNLALKPGMGKPPQKKSLGVQGDKLRIYRPKFNQVPTTLHSSPGYGRIQGPRDLGVVPNSPRPRAPATQVNPRKPGFGSVPQGPQVLERRRPSPGSFIHPRQPRIQRPSIPNGAIKPSTPGSPLRTPGMQRVTPSAPKILPTPQMRSTPKVRSHSAPAIKSNSSTRSTPKSSSSSSSSSGSRSSGGSHRRK